MWGFSLAVAHWLSKHQEKIQAEKKIHLPTELWSCSEHLERIIEFIEALSNTGASCVPLLPSMK